VLRQGAWRIALCRGQNENLGLFVVTYVDFLADGDPGKGEDELVRYGAATSKQSGQKSYTVLQQLDGPNRFVTLEVWDSVSDTTPGRATRRR
jgi:hypothetical protein